MTFLLLQLDNWKASVSNSPKNFKIDLAKVTGSDNDSKCRKQRDLIKDFFTPSDKGICSKEEIEIKRHLRWIFNMKTMYKIIRLWSINERSFKSFGISEIISNTLAHMDVQFALEFHFFLFLNYYALSNLLTSTKWISRKRKT